MSIVSYYNGNNLLILLLVNMGNYKRISIAEAQRLMSDDATIIDVRDPQSYSTDHIDNAVHVSSENIQQFIDDTDKTKPLIIYCYRGNSSQDAAEYLSNEGFLSVYSMDGGFEEWILNH
mgnify:CR=1 FL=1